jgi:hypothetical protein
MPPQLVNREAERRKMTKGLAVLLAHPYGLIVAGTIPLLLGLIGLSLFGGRDEVSSELDDPPKLIEKTPDRADHGKEQTHRSG